MNKKGFLGKVISLVKSIFEFVISNWPIILIVALVIFLLYIASP